MEPMQRDVACNPKKGQKTRFFLSSIINASDANKRETI
jgi:hypothetical protein